MSFFRPLRLALSSLRNWYIVYRSGGRLSLGDHVAVSRRSSIRAGNGRIDIGDRCRIEDGAILAGQDGFIRLGKRCSVNAYAVLYGGGRGGLTIGNDVRIAAHCVLVPSSHNFADASKTVFEQGFTSKGIVIEDDVWIGAHVTVLDGSHISRGCVIGAGAVVRGATTPFGVYVGVPAKLIQSRLSPT